MKPRRRQKTHGLCLEDYLFEFYDTQKAAYMGQLDQLNQPDLSTLPGQRAVASNINNASQIFNRFAEIKSAKSAITAASAAYAPMHSEVRAIERSIRQDEAELMPS